MSYQVSVTEVAARPTAVVAATTTWQEFPTLWKELLDEVWACLRAGGVHAGCRNIMLYRDDVPRVEVGVELLQPCPLTGRVAASALPAGPTATTVHHGPFTELASAHRAVLDWCAAQGRPPAGPRWEVNGPHRDNPAELWTEVLPAVMTGHCHGCSRPSRRLRRTNRGVTARIPDGGSYRARLSSL